jgi:hypothetical protein
VKQKQEDDHGEEDDEEVRRQQPQQQHQHKELEELLNVNLVERQLLRDQMALIALWGDGTVQSPLVQRLLVTADEVHDRMVTMLQGLKPEHYRALSMITRCRSGSAPPGTNVLVTNRSAEKQRNSDRARRMGKRCEANESPSSFPYQLRKQGKRLGVVGIGEGGICGATTSANRTLVARAFLGFTLRTRNGGSARLAAPFCTDIDSVLLDAGCGEAQCLLDFAALLPVHLVVGVEIGTSQLVNADVAIKKTIRKLRDRGLKLRSTIKMGLFNCMQEFIWHGVTHLFAYVGHPGMATSVCDAIAYSPSLKAVLVVCPQLPELFKDIMPADELTQPLRTAGYGFRPTSPEQAPIMLPNFACEKRGHSSPAMLVPVTHALRQHCKNMRLLPSATPAERLTSHKVSFMEAVQDHFFTYTLD